MGEEADYAVQCALDEEADGRDDFDRGRSGRGLGIEKHCRYCGQGKLRWGEESPGAWRLYDKRGKLHTCEQYAEAHPDRLPPAPTVPLPPSTVPAVPCHVLLGALDSGNLANVWVEWVYLDRAEADTRRRERAHCVEHAAFAVVAGKLRDVDDLVTLGRKLDDANAEIARLRACVERARLPRDDAE